MSIPALTQAYDEVRRLAIAGSVVAPGDFRLKKLVPALEQAGQKAPVFAKVAEAVSRLVGGDEQTSAAALLELATLVSSILYTQGETGAEGELTPLPTVELGRPRTQASARVLKPLLEALTNTGSGRLEVIRDGFERGAFHDLRLMVPVLGALDDGYGEIADLVAHKVLPLYGRAIVPELQAAFDPRGRGGHVRRLLLMHRLDPEAARPFVQRSLEEGSPEVRVAAIGCLGDSPDDLAFLLEQAKSRSKDVRVAALKALGRCGADEAARVLGTAIQRDLALAVDALRLSRHAAVTGAVLGEAESQFQALIGGKEKDAKKLGPQNERMGLLLECLRGREDPGSEKLLLTMFGNAGRLAAVKGTPSGNDVVLRLVSVMADGTPEVRSALIDAHASLPPEGFTHAFMAARRSREPAEVFALFSPYVSASPGETKKGRSAAQEKREAVIEQLMNARVWEDPDGEESPAPADLDPRWLDLAVRIGHEALVRALAVPGHAGAMDYLAELFRQKLARSGQEYELSEVLDAMIRVGHPGATDALVELLKKFARAKTGYGYYGISYWVGRLIPGLPPAEALPKLEALLPTLPERMIDQLLDFVTELKRVTPTAAST